MTIWLQFSQFAGVVREFVVPSYHPERHYMRGPGPACARRRGNTMEARLGLN